mmetsp:Transcript_46684/g.107147  ORF Transcript_46684/g.107147 Transcript_46684/m.107147 type:complete len:150 (-) Transcript_46684:439-888(-)
MCIILLPGYLPFIQEALKPNGITPDACRRSISTYEPLMHYVESMIELTKIERTVNKKDDRKPLLRLLPGWPARLRTKCMVTRGGAQAHADHRPVRSDACACPPRGCCGKPSTAHIIGSGEEGAYFPRKARFAAWAALAASIPPALLLVA